MCVSPLILKNPDPQKFLGATIQVPCGKCVECLKSRQDQWKLRLMQECKNYRYCYFFTLTYNDCALPVTDQGLSTACKRDVQLWIKKFRTAFERLQGVKLSDYLKYFICAEYGPNGTHRPHYHGLFMTDLDEMAISTLFHDWSQNKGFVKWDSISFNPDERQAVSNYVSKYCCKGEFASRSADIEAGLIEKAWTLVSKGVGASYCENPATRRYHLPFGRTSSECFRSDYLDTVIERQKVSFSTPNGVFTYRMPRYYRERLYMSKLPFDSLQYDVKTKKMVHKTVYRYSSKTLFARCLQARIRDRFLERASILDVITDLSPETRQPLVCNLRMRELNSLAAREASCRGKLATFYLTNANRWKSL